MVATVALVAAVSCNKEFEQENIPAGGQTVVYTATVDQNDEPEAKAVLDGLVSKWSGNEYITLHDGSNGFYFHADAGETPVETIDFSYTPGEGDPAFTSTDVMAVYPSGNYSADIANKKVSGVVVPEKQQLVDGTYPATAAVAVAYSSDTKILEFKNACALLKFKVAGDDVTRGCFYAEGDISGVFDVAYNGGKPTMTATEAKKWVDFHNDEQFLSEQATYYIAIAPGSVANFKMYLGSKEIKKYNSEYTFKRNVILDLGTLTYEAPEYAKTVYLKPGEWASDGAKFAAYFFSSTGNEGVMMEDTDSDGIYEATVPESDYSRVIFCRMDSASESFSWESKWNQTNNLDIPEASDNNLCYVITGWGEGEGAKSVGEWKSLEMATAVWTIAGAFNNWTAAPMVKSGDYFVAEDVTKLHSVENGFKILENGNWLGGPAVEVGVWTALGGSDNIYVTGAASDTKYDVYVNPTDKKFAIVAAGAGAPSVAVTTYGICGDLTGWKDDGESDYPMEKVDGKYVAYGVTFSSAGSFKIRSNNSWDENYGFTTTATATVGYYYNLTANSSGNVTVAAGKYDIWFDKDLKRLYIVTPGSSITSLTEGNPILPSSDVWYLIGTFNDWALKDADYKFTYEAGWFVLRNCVISSNAQAKLNNGSWSVERSGTFNGINGSFDLSGSANFSLPKGTYDIYMNSGATKIYFLAPGKTPSSSTYRLYIKNSVGEDNVVIYAWNGGYSTSWPGEKLTGSTTVEGYGLCYYKELSTAQGITNFLVHDGNEGNKTGDKGIADLTVLPTGDLYFEW